MDLKCFEPRKWSDQWRYPTVPRPQVADSRARSPGSPEVRPSSPPDRKIWGWHHLPDLPSGKRFFSLRYIENGPFIESSLIQPAKQHGDFPQLCKRLPEGKIAQIEPSWLVVCFFIFPSVGNVIIPTDELIFFRGVGIPPTSFTSSTYWCVLRREFSGIIIIQSQPPATHPATLRKTHQ